MVPLTADFKTFSCTNRVCKSMPVSSIFVVDTRQSTVQRVIKSHVLKL